MRYVDFVWCTFKNHVIFCNIAGLSKAQEHLAKLTDQVVGRSTSDGEIHLLLLPTVVGVNLVLLYLGISSTIARQLWGMDQQLGEVKWGSLGRNDLEGFKKNIQRLTSCRSTLTLCCATCRGLSQCHHPFRQSHHPFRQSHHPSTQSHHPFSRSHQPFSQSHHLCASSTPPLSLLFPKGGTTLILHSSVGSCHLSL